MVREYELQELRRKLSRAEDIRDKAQSRLVPGIIWSILWAIFFNTDIFKNIFIFICTITSPEYRREYMQFYLERNVMPGVITFMNISAICVIIYYVVKTRNTIRDAEETISSVNSRMQELISASPTLSHGNSYSDFWNCTCGNKVHRSQKFCSLCGKPQPKVIKPQPVPSPASPSAANQPAGWECICGQSNPFYLSKCSCGISKKSTKSFLSTLTFLPQNEGLKQKLGEAISSESHSTTLRFVELLLQNENYALYHNVLTTIMEEFPSTQQRQALQLLYNVL